MINIKKYIDRVTAVERRGGRDVVIGIDEACAMRDELLKLLLDYHAAAKTTQQEINVEFIGGKW